MAAVAASDNPRSTWQYFEHPPRSHLYRSSIPTVDSSFSEHQSRNGAKEYRRDRTGDGYTKKTLNPLLLTGLMYTFTMGGGYGIEESVMGGGPLLTILSIIIMPVLMSLPTALVVAELASAVPSNAGFLMWVNLAFHRAFFLWTSLLSLLLILVDNALYPVLFSDYLCTAVTCTRSTHVLLRLAMILLSYVLNLLGIRAVGVLSIVLTIVTVSPFVLMLTMHLFPTGFYLNWPAISYIPSRINWPVFIATASWNLSGLEQAGSVVEEIKDPQHTILRAFIPLIGLAFVTYIPPILVGASSQYGPINLSEWSTGFWSEVSYRVGGMWFKYYTVMAGVLSAFGLTLAALCTTTSIIAGMALTDVFPGKPGVWLCERNHRFGSYHWALTVNTTLTVLFSCLLDFGPLVKIDQFLYGLRVVAIFAAFFRFRVLYPLLTRPYRIPLEGTKLYAFMVLPMLSFAGLTIVSLLQDTQTMIWCLSVAGGCGVVSCLFCIFYRREDYPGRIVTV